MASLALGGAGRGSSQLPPPSRAKGGCGSVATSTQKHTLGMEVKSSCHPAGLRKGRGQSHTLERCPLDLKTPSWALPGSQPSGHALKPRPHGRHPPFVKSPLSTWRSQGNHRPGHSPPQLTKHLLMH